MISVRHHSTYHAVSNMPIESISPPDNFDIVTTTFRRITSMQTYLVVFTISDFVFVEDTTVVPPQRVYARESLISAGDAELAMKVSPEILEFCEEYFGINYTFPKMDQVENFYNKFKIILNSLRLQCLNMELLRWSIGVRVPTVSLSSCIDIAFQRLLIESTSSRS